VTEPAAPAPQSDPAGTLYRAFLERGARQRGVDKWHHYFDIYERHFAPFRGRDVTLIEIGVQRGGSLELWKSYFGAGSRILGVDLDPACAGHAPEGTRILTGDQADPAFLRQVLAESGPPDIVIDDGGHTMNQMITSFEALYPALRSPGVYLVEDTHTCFWGGRYADRADRRSFMDFAFSRCADLHQWTGRPAHFQRLGQPPEQRQGAIPVSEFCRRTAGISFYDSVVVFERRDRPEPWREVR
jgi:hypothetical protein